MDRNAKEGIDMTPDVRQQPIEIEIPAERKWTLAVTDDVGFADIWEKGYTDEDSILTITVIPRTRPTPAAPTSESEAEDSFRIYRSEWQSLESMLDECGCDDGKRILYQILTEERDLEHLDAAVAAQAREDMRKEIDPIFDHVVSLCDAIIEKQDPQSLWGFNSLLIKRQIEPIRTGGERR